MGGITKRGDRYLRKQLIHGARALVSRAAKSTDPLSLWATKLRITKPFNKVAVAVAHRLADIPHLFRGSNYFSSDPVWPIHRRIWSCR
jgi:transposase